MSAVINCVVVTPEETALDTKTEFIALPLFDGEKGVGANHSPMIGRLGFGELRLGRGDKIERYYVDGGFVQVADNVVSVLTSRAVPAGELDVEAAEQQLKDAEKMPFTTPEQMEIRERLIRQARAQINTAKRSR